MRFLAAFLLTLTFTLPLTAQTTTVQGISVGDTAFGGFRLHIENREQYFKYMDLDSVYLSPAYDGSPAYFIYSEFDRDNDGTSEAPVIGVYFKGQTGLTAAGTYNDEAPASDVSRGYSCTTDDNEAVAKMDALSINGHVFSNEYDNQDVQKNAVLALNDYLSGYRIVDLGKSEYFGRCNNGKLLDKDDWVYSTIMVFEWVSKKDYTDGKKADMIRIDITPGGFGVFSFQRTKDGKIANSDKLKELYVEAGFMEPETPKKKKAN